MAERPRDDALNRDSRFRMTEQFAIGGIPTGVAMLIAALMLGAVAPSSAQNVPIPKPAPKSRNIVMSASDAARGPITTGATQAQPPEPVIPDPRRNVPVNIFASFDAGQKAQAAKVSAYLSSLQTLVGNFVQVGPDGSKTKGDFYI